MIRRSLATFVAAAALTAALCGCEKVNVVSSSVSPCFRVLPLARAALSGQGAYVDVARVRASALPRIPGLRRRPRPTTTTSPLAPPVTRLDPTGADVCIVAYRGSFDPAQIPQLAGPRAGKYAVVVIGVRSQRVRAVVLTDHLPSPLHAH